MPKSLIFMILFCSGFLLAMSTTEDNQPAKTNHVKLVFEKFSKIYEPDAMVFYQKENSSPIKITWVSYLKEGDGVQVERKIHKIKEIIKF